MVITIRTANQTSNSNVQIKKRYLICDYQLLGNKIEIVLILLMKYSDSC